MKPSHSRYLSSSLIPLLLTSLAILCWAGGPSVLVSIDSDNSGVVSPSGKRLYVSVTQDGVMTYADRTDKGILLRTRTLTTTELSRLQEVLHGSKLTALRGTLTAGQFHPRDYQTSLRITILHDAVPQEFTLVDYDPSAGRDFPAGAKELLCLVEELRRSSYRLSKDCK